MKILYLGDDNPNFTSAHRANALRRLGHEVKIINPRALLPQSPLVGGLSTRVGLWPFAPWIDAGVRRKVGGESFDLAWIDCGAEISPKLHRWMRARGLRIINYNIDDPFGVRDGRKWDLYRQSVREQDLTVVVRNENVAEARQHDARQVLRVYRSYDPVAHAPFAMSAKDERDWSSEVAFVGTWMPERGPFMERLLDLSVPLAIWGHSWHKAKEWSRLQNCWRGPSANGADYVKAIQGAKIMLGLLSKGNRDLHTTRSAEVPFVGGAVLCAERTVEHEKMFIDGREALLWSTAEECAMRCKVGLADQAGLKRLAENGRRRVIQLRLSNDEVLETVLTMLKGEIDVMEPSFPAHESL
jgi:spore maturation protein CgeB